MSHQASQSVSIPVDQFNKGMLEISIAKDFFSFLSQDLEREDSILRGMESERQQGLLCAISCLLDSGTEALLHKPA